MHGRWRKAMTLAAATASTLIAGGARGQIDGTWIGPAGGSWMVGNNWSSNPQYPSAGGTATFEDVGAQSVTLAGGTLLLSALHIDSLAQVDINAASSSSTIKFTGPGIIDVPLYKQNKPGVAPYFLGHTFAPQIA